ncbi:hypothetical protein DFH08DRAFT_980308 [Mycena albidolilacea]|uniref:Uncharacterized protein n=1 Tax=Mycena albidolilacea TaxID=1033008 RepID=A0AAD7ATJ1_9AGAR|nr:hypothetical protein DFH08DRAFT_980308 [Mycena albidolilacea]
MFPRPTSLSIFCNSASESCRHITQKYYNHGCLFGSLYIGLLYAVLPGLGWKMDPFTVTATIITLVTFIKDLIEVDEGIRRSIEKVRNSSAQKQLLKRMQVNENRRQVRELMDDVVRILYDLDNLLGATKTHFVGHSALGNLKAEMLYVHSKCRKISPVQLPGFCGVSSQLKAWRKHNNLEGRIGHLKEHAFSAARIEQTTLRIEQALIINNVENQVKAQHLEELMAQVLLETQFGHNVANRTINIISADPTHTSLESQYISAQTMCLINLLEQLLISGKLVLDAPLLDPTQISHFIFEEHRPLHLLHQILEATIEINRSRDLRIPLKSMKNIMVSLRVSLCNLGMASESIAWEHLKIWMLHYLGCSATTSPDMAHTMTMLSIAYQRQHQFQSAIQASQQSLNLWRHLSDSLPGVDNHICLIIVLKTHARNLLETGEKIAALSIAQDTVSLSHLVLGQIIDSGSVSPSSVDDFKAVWSYGVFFELAKALSSLDHHVELYEATKEGYQAILQLPDNSPPSMENIHIFLEPNLDHPSPKLDTTGFINIDLGPLGGIQVGDVVRAFYTFPTNSTKVLIWNIIITYFDEANLVLCDMVALLEVLAKTIRHFGAILVSSESDWEWVLEDLFEPIFRHFWRTALLDDALKVSEEVIKYLNSHHYTDNTVACRWKLNQCFILCDMGRFSDAAGMAQQTTMASVPEEIFLHPCIIQTRILCCAGRNQEALQLLWRGVVAGCRKDWENNVKVFHLQLNMLLVESAATWGHLGHRERALEEAEQAVAACRKDTGPDEHVEEQKCILIHSLVTLSDCLDRLGRNDEALTAAQEVVLLYTENVPQMWGNFLYTIKRPELGANAFHVLSLRLKTSGMAEQALVNAENTTELYRMSGTRHLPALASNLRNLSSSLWHVGRRDKAITASRQAVGAIQEVGGLETYFLPALAKALDQLVNYFREEGDVGGASAAVAECAEVQKEFAALPPQPEFVFEKVVAELEEQAAVCEAPLYASEADEDPDTSVVGASTSKPSSLSSTTGCPSIDTQSKLCEVSNAGGDDVAINGSTNDATLVVEGKNATDTAIHSIKHVLNKPLLVEVRLSMRSTIMDILWWIILGISFAVACKRAV